MVSVSSSDFFVLPFVVVIVVLLPASPVLVYRLQSLRLFLLFRDLNRREGLFLGLLLLVLSLDRRLFLFFRIFLILNNLILILVVHSGVIEFFVGSLSDRAVFHVFLDWRNVYNFKSQFVGLVQVGLRIVCQLLFVWELLYFHVDYLRRKRFSGVRNALSWR